MVMFFHGTIASIDKYVINRRTFRRKFWMWPNFLQFYHCPSFALDLRDSTLILKWQTCRISNIFFSYLGSWTITKGIGFFSPLCFRIGWTPSAWRSIISFSVTPCGMPLSTTFKVFSSDSWYVWYSQHFVSRKSIIFRYSSGPSGCIRTPIFW